MNIAGGRPRVYYLLVSVLERREKTDTHVGTPAKLLSQLLWTLHPGAGKLMRSARDFFPGDAPTQHDVDSQLPLTRGEIVYVNVSNARAPDGMVKATRLHEQDDQGFIPFDLMMDLDDDEHAAVRNTLNES